MSNRQSSSSQEPPAAESAQQGDSLGGLPPSNVKIYDRPTRSPLSAVAVVILLLIVALVIMFTLHGRH